MTETELKELGISRELFDKWRFVMDSLWSTAQMKTATHRVEAVNNGDNGIRFTTKTFGRADTVWTIGANMINNKYIEVVVSKQDHEFLTMRYDNNMTVVLDCVFLVTLQKR